MINIKYNDNIIRLNGHSATDICAGISSITYTGINFLLDYDKECINVVDDMNGDYLEITFNKHNKIIDNIRDTMIKMYKDVLDQVPSDSISMEVIPDEA